MKVATGWKHAMPFGFCWTARKWNDRQFLASVATKGNWNKIDSLLERKKITSRPTYNSGLQINKDRSRDVFSWSSLAEKRVERIITIA